MRRRHCIGASAADAIAGNLLPADDIFALGCVLYECLTGPPPFFAGHIAAVLVRILFEDPRPVRDRCPSVPQSVATLLDRMLAKLMVVLCSAPHD